MPWGGEKFSVVLETGRRGLLGADYERATLEEGMATHSSIPAWRIDRYGQRSLQGYTPRGCKESDTTEASSHARKLQVDLSAHLF